MNTNEIARIASLVGEPARAAMLMALMDGRALTANELAIAAHIGAPTASRHLGQMVEGGLLTVEKQGRHRYHRLASPQVAKLLEGMMQLASAARPAPRTGPRDEAMRTARVCYDHIAGRLGLAITEQWLAEKAIAFDEDGGQVLPGADTTLRRWGIVADLQLRGRPLCRPCLDWSERRPHLAGRLGALLCAHCLEQGWLTRKPGARALAITPTGAARLRDLLGLAAWERVSAASSSA